MPAGLGRACVAELGHDYCRCAVDGRPWRKFADLDGARIFRCGCCGSDWRTEWLRCPFCGESDHEKLGSLVSADRLERHGIEVCDGCRGYLKTFTTLTAILPGDVLLEDLATLALDMAALERDYRRPPRGDARSRSAWSRSPGRLRDLLSLRP